MAGLERLWPESALDKGSLSTTFAGFSIHLPLFKAIDGKTRPWGWARPAEQGERPLGG